MSVRGSLVSALIRPGKLFYRIFRPSARMVRLYVHPQAWLGAKLFGPFGVGVEKKMFAGVPGVTFRPKKNPRDDKLIVYLHGGGYCFGSSLTSHRMGLTTMCKITNFVCHSIDYRLAPENPYPAALDDAVASWRHIVEKNPKKNLLFEILRNENVFYINIVPYEFYEKNSKRVLGRIGVTAAPSELITLSILPALKFGILDSMNMTFEWLKGLKALLSFEVDKKDVLGPIGIAKISGSSLDRGFASVIFLMAVLSINLGLINLLPIPALDGGYILLFTYELIFGKPLSGSIQLFLLKFGFLFLISLMVIVTAFDLGL